MYPGTRPSPQKTSYIEQRTNTQQQQTWNPPISLPQRTTPTQSKHEWSPHDWIKEWSQALEKSAYPQWESWFQKRDWNCDGHLSVKQPAFFSESLQIGDINLQHKLHVKGDAYLCGNLYVEGRVIHSAGRKNKEDNWDLQEEPDINNWEETFDTYHHILTTNNNENWGGISVHSENFEQSSGLFFEFHENSLDTYMKGWNGKSSFQKEQPVPVHLHVDHVHVYQTLHANAEKSVSVEGSWEWANGSILNLEQTTLHLPVKLEWDSPEIVLRNQSKLQLHGQNITLVGTTSVIQSDFHVDNWFSIFQDGHGTFMGENFIFRETIQANQGIFKEGITVPRVIIDDVLHVRRIVTQETVWVGGTLQVAPGYSFHTDQIVIENSQDWLQLPEESAGKAVINLSAEYWGQYRSPTSRPLTEEDPGKLSNKTLGTDLDASNQRITRLAEPKDTGDAATKAYVDRVRLPWKTLDTVNVWISQTEIEKVASYVKQSMDWTGKISGSSNPSLVGLKQGDRVGIYPEKNNTGCGIFIVMETFDMVQVESWRQHDFLLSIAQDFQEWQTNTNGTSTIWVGGPGHLWIIEQKLNRGLVWNVLMEWPEPNQQLNKQIDQLQKRIAVLESEFKTLRH